MKRTKTMDIINTLITSVFYHENGCPVPFYEDGTMSFFGSNMQSTNVGKYEPVEGDNRIKITMCRDNSMTYLRLVIDENGKRLYNSFGSIFASDLIHTQTRYEPTARELQGTYIPEPLIPAMIVVYSIGQRSHDILCKRHWIWKDNAEIKRLRFYPGGSIVELHEIYNTPTEVGSWRMEHVPRRGGCRAFYQPPGDSQNMRRVATSESVCISFINGNVKMYIMVDPKDESLVYLQQERSAFKVMDDDTVRLVDIRGRQACYAERVI